MAQYLRGYKKVGQGLEGGKRQFSNLEKLYFQKMFLKKHIYSMSGFCRWLPDYKYIKRYTLYYVTMKVKRTAIIKKKDCQQVDIEKGLTSLSIEFRRFNQVPPGKKTIQQNFTKYCSYGTSLTRNEENSGRQRNARSEENIKLVRNIIWQAY